MRKSGGILFFNYLYLERDTSGRNFFLIVTGIMIYLNEDVPHSTDEHVVDRPNYANRLGWEKKLPAKCFSIVYE